MELLTAAQMRAIEQSAIDSGEVTGLELMERAGRGVVEAIFEWRPELAEGERSAVVLCGPGNNGGDGFVVARLLKERGWAVEVFLYGDEAKLPPDAAENARRWREMGTVEPVLSIVPYLPFRDRDIVIDAIFGIGLKRPVEKELSSILRLWRPTSWIALDVPSGLDADSGRLLREDCLPELPGLALADLTVTFATPKIGHFLADGPVACGELAVADIGLRKGDLFRAALSAYPRRSDLVTLARNSKEIDKKSKLAPQLALRHKYDHGHALILSGGMGRTGAARLAARAALRIGAGLVTVGSPADAMAENVAHLTAIMLRETDSMDDFAKVLEDERINALCLGPGMGVGHRTELLMKRALAAKRATVLDADALTVFANDPPALFALLHERCVLTPHQGEFGRLFPDILEKLKSPATTGPAYSKVDATREAAARAGCVVLFKGADTVIADPSGRASINSAHYERAAPWLATAGSGDVLAGMITGLLARGLPPMSAAESAAWLHVECGRHLGPGLIAEDIPEALPTILKRVLDWTPPPRNGSSDHDA